MAIVKRTVKGSALTYQELDGNFEDLDSRLQNYENSSAADIGSSNIDFGPNKILFANVYPNLSDLEAVSPASYHGMFAHVHSTGKAYYAHAGAWVELANASDVSASGIALSDLSVTTASASGGGSLSYNNTTGTFTYTPPAITNYTDSDVDSHLNTSTATNNQILSWNGSDYAWVTNSADIASNNIGDLANVSSASASSGQVLKWDGSQWAPASDSIGDGSGGITFGDLSVTTNPAGSAALSYNNTNGTFTYTPPDLSAYSTFDGAFSSLTGTPTTLAGYGITDAFDGTFSSLSGTPTTLAGYGITDAPSDLTDLGITDGSNGQVLTTDGAGNFTFTTVSGGSGISNIVEDTTPQLGGDLDVNGKTIAHELSLGSTSSSTNYTFTDPGNNWFPSSETDPVLYLRRGETYNFTNVPGSHPFIIRTSAGGSTYSTGVTNNGGTGTVSFTVPMSAPTTLYYQCTVHSGMGNTINIV